MNTAIEKLHRDGKKASEIVRKKKERKSCAVSHSNVEKLEKKLKSKLFVPRVTKLSLASAVLSLKRADILNKLNSILKIIHLPLIFFKKKILLPFAFLI